MTREYIEYDDVLREGTDKLNKSIEKAYDADEKSDGAVSTANDAKEQSQQAEDKADNVQQQFDQVVIEGDSSVEAAQARVKEDGTEFDTLRDRLNDSDEQLAHIDYKILALGVNVKEDLGAKGDGETDDTEVLNSHKEGDTLIFPAGTYMIKADQQQRQVRGFVPKNNTKVIFLGGAKLKCIPTDSDTYVVYNIGENVTTEGYNLEIEGDRNEHTGDGGEWGFGLSIRDNVNAKIYGVKVYNCWGDGVYLNTDSGSYVEVHNVDSYNNRRQGLSVTGCGVARFYNTVFRDTNGTSPQAGIDIEPNVGRSIDDIYFKNTTIKDNAGSGLLLFGLHTTQEMSKIIFEDTFFDGEPVEISTNRENYNSKILFKGYTIIKDSGGYALHLFGNNELVEFDDLTIVNANRNNSLSDNTGACILVESREDIPRSGKLLIKDLKVVGGEFHRRVITLWPKMNELYDVKVNVSGMKNVDSNRVIKKHTGTYSGKIDINTGNELDLQSNLSSVSNYLNTKITNKGASDNVSVNISHSEAQTFGTVMEFDCVENERLGINAVDKIIYPFNNTAIRSSIKGSRVKLRFDGNDWFATEVVGDWAEE